MSDQPVRLVATDIDGTLMPYRSVVSERTRAAVTAAVERGVHVVYATGRPPRWMPPIVEATGHAGLAICANGAIVVDTATGEVLETQVLARDVVARAAEVLRRAVPGVRFALETPAALWVEGGYERRRDAGEHDVLPQTAPIEAAAVDRVEEVPDDGAYKLVAITTALDPDAFLDVTRAELGETLSVTASSPTTALVEIAAPGVTKASGLARLASRLGVPQAAVVAFGDMPNDVEMLAWAGRGYAMAGGHPDAIAAAAHTAPPSADDGVARVLETLLG